jgi:hypothetical protein
MFFLSLPCGGGTLLMMVLASVSPEPASREPQLSMETPLQQPSNVDPYKVNLTAAIIEYFILVNSLGHWR